MSYCACAICSVLARRTLAQVCESLGASEHLAVANTVIALCQRLLRAARAGPKDSLSYNQVLITLSDDAPHSGGAPTFLHNGGHTRLAVLTACCYELRTACGSVRLASSSSGSNSSSGGPPGEASSSSSSSPPGEASSSSGPPGEVSSSSSSGPPLDPQPPPQQQQQQRGPGEVSITWSPHDNASVVHVAACLITACYPCYITSHHPLLEPYTSLARIDGVQRRQALAAPGAHEQHLIHSLLKALKPLNPEALNPKALKALTAPRADEQHLILRLALTQPCY